MPGGSSSILNQPPTHRKIENRAKLLIMLCRVVTGHVTEVNRVVAEGCRVGVGGMVQALQGRRRRRPRLSRSFCAASN
jgi:hypothetical protein